MMSANLRTGDRYKAMSETKFPSGKKKFVVPLNTYEGKDELQKYESHPANPMSPPRRLDRVLYRGTTLATVLTVHMDEVPPYYTIFQDDGIERQTELRYLQPVETKKDKTQVDANSSSHKKMTGYVYYCRYYRDGLKTVNPEMKGVEINKELARQWKELTKEEKKKWTDSAAALE